MSRDWAPFEHYLSEQRWIKEGNGDLFDFMEDLKLVYNDGKEVILHSAEEMALRRQFSSLGRLLMDDFPKLYEQCSRIEGGLNFLHQKDNELTAFLNASKVVESEPGHSVLKVDHTDIDEDSYLIKWFTGTLDEHFYYSERNNELFCANVLLEAQLLSGKVWVCVYKDALEYQDDLDNLTDILVPAEWLLAQLKSEGVEDFNEWFSEYTADETEDIARKALAEGVILDCQDECLKSYCMAKVRALGEADRASVEALDSVSGNDVCWGLDAEGYAWGVFLGDELVGYCTIGGADDPDMGYDDFSQWTNDSLCLSDVFVKKEHRGEGLACRLVEEALEKSNPNSRDSVFITLLDDELINFYEALGFKSIADGVMVREKGKVPSLESQINDSRPAANSNVEKVPLSKEFER